MLLAKERQAIVEYGKKLIERGLTVGTGGNLSVINRERQLVAITPSGLDYVETTLDDVVIINLDGEVVEGHLVPSSEYNMHLIFYRNRPDVNAVVHTHSTFSTTLSCLNWTLPAVHYLVAFGGEEIKCAKYATYGTEALAKNAYEAMGNDHAVFLANHGLLTVGDSLESAFNCAEQIEFCAELYYRAKSIGEPVILDREEMAHMAEKFKTYGQPKSY